MLCMHTHRGPPQCCSSSTRPRTVKSTISQDDSQGHPVRIWQSSGAVRRYPPSRDSNTNSRCSRKISPSRQARRQQGTDAAVTTTMESCSEERSSGLLPDFSKVPHERTGRRPDRVNTGTTNSSLNKSSGVTSRTITGAGESEWAIWSSIRQHDRLIPYKKATHTRADPASRQRTVTSCHRQPDGGDQDKPSSPLPTDQIQESPVAAAGVANQEPSPPVFALGYRCVTRKLTYLYL